jgi:hypothetical protein
MDADNNCMMQIHIPKSDNRIIHIYNNRIHTCIFIFNNYKGQAVARNLTIQKKNKNKK